MLFTALKHHTVCLMWFLWCRVCLVQIKRLLQCDEKYEKKSERERNTKRAKIWRGSEKGNRRWVGRKERKAENTSTRTQIARPSFASAFKPGYLNTRRGARYFAGRAFQQLKNCFDSRWHCARWRTNYGYVSIDIVCFFTLSQCLNHAVNFCLRRNK